MTPEALRVHLLTRIDDALSYTILVRGEGRSLLLALRGYVAVMTAADLEKFALYLAPTAAVGATTQGEFPMAEMCEFEYPTEADACAAACCLHEMASGTEPIDAACASHCSWVIHGYLLSQAAPAAPCPCDQPARDKLKAAAAPFVEKAAGKKLALDWMSALRTLLQLLLAILPPASGAAAKP